MQAHRPGEQDREELSCAMDAEPGREFQRQALAREDPQHRAKQRHIVHQ